MAEGYGSDFYSDGIYGFTNVIVVTGQFDAPALAAERFASNTTTAQGFDAGSAGVIVNA